MMNIKNVFNNKYISAVAAVLCVFLWGTAFPAVKMGYTVFNIESNDIGSELLFAGERFLIAGIMVIVCSSVYYKKFVLPKKEDILPVSLLGFVQITVQYIFYYIGLSFTQGSKGAVLVSFDAFIAVLISPIFFKNDKITVKKLCGALIGILGIVIVNFDGMDLSSFKFMGEGFILISATTSTFGSVINKKVVKHKNNFMVSGYHLVIGSVFLIALGLLMSGKVKYENTACCINMFYLSFISAAAFSVWSLLLRVNDISKMSAIKLLLPIFGSVSSAVVLHENILNITFLLAVVLVCLGIFLVNYKFKFENKIS